MFGRHRKATPEKVFLDEKAFRVSAEMKFRFKPAAALVLRQRLKRLKKWVSAGSGAGKVKSFFTYYGVKYFHMDSDVKRRFSD